MAKTIMIQGTMSNVGKSIFTTGLCRVFRQEGYKVAPFKSQNMSSSSHVLPNGLQISSSQSVQAEACGLEATASMNPILLKVKANHGMEVFVGGKSQGYMNSVDYFNQKSAYIPIIMQSFEELASQNDIVVIEGAGSPVEINLNENDFVNMGLAKLTKSPVLLVGDINPGGIFAQFFGTLGLLSEQERKLVKALVINKFCGNVESLSTGIEMLEEKCHCDVAGVLPYLKLNIEAEDSLSDVVDKSLAFEERNQQYDFLADSIRENINLDLIYQILEKGA